MSILSQNSKKSTKSQPIFSGSKVIGYVESGVFRKSLNFSRHALRTPPAIAFDLSSLDDAERAGADRVDITDRESGRHYLVKIADIRKDGFPVNRGFGSQIALGLSYFSIDGKPPTATPAKARHEQPASKQLSLFPGR